MKPLTPEQCRDMAEVRERFLAVLDRFFLNDNDYAVTAAWDALEYEVLRPLWSELERRKGEAHYEG